MYGDELASLAARLGKRAQEAGEENARLRKENQDLREGLRRVYVLLGGLLSAEAQEPETLVGTDRPLWVPPATPALPRPPVKAEVIKRAEERGKERAQTTTRGARRKHRRTPGVDALMAYLAKGPRTPEEIAGELGGEPGRVRDRLRATEAAATPLVRELESGAFEATIYGLARAGIHERPPGATRPCEHVQLLVEEMEGQEVTSLHLAALTGISSKTVADALAYMERRKSAPILEKVGRGRWLVRRVEPEAASEPPPQSDTYPKQKADSPAPEVLRRPPGVFDWRSSGKDTQEVLDERTGQILGHIIPTIRNGEPGWDAVLEDGRQGQWWASPDIAARGLRRILRERQKIEEEDAA